MNNADEPKVTREEALGEYCTYLKRLHDTVMAKGEAFVLRQLISNPRLIKAMQNAYTLLFLEARELSKQSPEFLVGFEELGLETSVLIKFYQSPDQRYGWYHDFAENVPPAYVDSLLEEPRPFYRFEAALRRIEIGKLCSIEIRRRATKHPELEQLLRYKANTPEREAWNYLKGKGLPERARLAEKYGLKGLAHFERAIDRSLADIVQAVQKKHGLKGWIEIRPKHDKLRYKIRTVFPECEE